MSNIKQQTLKRALAMLNAIEAKYAVIDIDGNKYGDLEVSEKTKTARKYPHGELSAYASSHMANMSITDVCEIPFGKYEGAEVRGAAVSWACYHWGNGSVTTSTNTDKKVVEVLRIE